MGPNRFMLIQENNVFHGFLGGASKIANLETITAERAKHVIEMNRHGEKPVSLQEDGAKKPETQNHVDLAGGDINRFDRAKKKKKKKNNRPAGNHKKEGDGNNHAE